MIPSIIYDLLVCINIEMLSYLDFNIGGKPYDVTNKKLNEKKYIQTHQQSGLPLISNQTEPY